MLSPLNTTQSYDFFGQNGTASDEILVYFYQGNPSLQDQATLAQTCKRLFQVFQDNVIWRPLLKRDFDEEVPKNSGLTGGYEYYKMLSQVPKNILAHKWSYQELLSVDGKEICCFQKSGDKVYTGSIHGEVKSWDVKTQKEIRTLGNCIDPIKKIKVEGGLIAATSIFGKLKVWDIQTGEELLSKERLISFELDRSILYMQENSKDKIQTFNLKTRQKQASFQFQGLNCWNVRDGRLYVNEGRNFDVQIFSIADRALSEVVKFQTKEYKSHLNSIFIEQTYLYASVEHFSNRRSDTMIWNVLQKRMHYSIKHIFSVSCAHAGTIYIIDMGGTTTVGLFKKEKWCGRILGSVFKRLATV